MRAVALITAGGQGMRMGGPCSKQYLELRGIPILARTATLFQNHPLIEAIILTVPPQDKEFVTSTIVERFALDKVTGVVEGGPTRQASVYNGLRSVRDADIVAIHDGVRPFVRPEVISGTIEAAERSGAALACAPVRDTVKRRNGSYLETIPRSSLWLAHTPQAFRAGLILEAHRKAIEDGFEGTDDSVLVERLGYPVEIVEDSDNNLKITTEADLERALAILEP
jgi:2-C-methyl-D-erythritol 4-phosphate cytidylyltransferase